MKERSEMQSEAEVKFRTCANCACYIVRENPLDPKQKQGFCELNPPGFAIIKVKIPRMVDGKPVMSKREPIVPLMDEVDQGQYVYPPMDPTLRCFSGWRPIGSEPGRHDIKEDMGALMETMEPIMNALGIFRAKPPLDG